MRAPGFWSNPPAAPGGLARLLTPLSALWRLGAWLRAARTAETQAPVPVICVGNLVAGGAGKTPLAADLLMRLAERGAAPMALSRGHGGSETGPLRVDPARHDAAQAGDEPLMLSGWAPVWIARDRAAGALAAAQDGAGVIVMDDGFQNPSLRKDLSILVVDAAQGFGNGRVIPAGPLREPVAKGLARADAVVVTGAQQDADRLRRDWPALFERPVLRAHLAPLETGLMLEGSDVVAFAGIGRPEKFFATLEEMGARLIARRSFPDHAAYSDRALRRLLSEARRAHAMLVTTEKDMVRLPEWFRREATALPVRLRFAEDDAVEALLDRVAPR